MTGLGWNGLDWAGLGWSGLDCAGLGRTWLDWAGLDWAGLGWTGLAVLVRKKYLDEKSMDVCSGMLAFGKEKT